MRKTVTILLLVTAALWGLASCEGSYMDPGALEMMGGLLGGDHDHDYDDDGGSSGGSSSGGNSGGNSGGSSELTVGNLVGNGDRDWKNDATSYQMAFVGSSMSNLFAYIGVDNSEPVEYGVVTISGNTMTWRNGNSCNLSLSSNGNTLTVSGYTGSDKKVNGSYRKRD